MNWFECRSLAGFDELKRKIRLSLRGAEIPAPRLSRLRLVERAELWVLRRQFAGNGKTPLPVLVSLARTTLERFPALRRYVKR